MGMTFPLMRVMASVSRETSFHNWPHAAAHCTRPVFANRNGVAIGALIARGRIAALDAQGEMVHTWDGVL